VNQKYLKYLFPDREIRRAEHVKQRAKNQYQLPALFTESVSWQRRWITSNI